MSRFFLCLSVFFILVTIIIAPYQQAQASIIDVPVEYVEKQAVKKSMSFLIFKEVKSTVKDLAEKEVSEEVADKYVKREGFILVRDAAERRAYFLEKKFADEVKSGTISAEDNAKLESAIEQTIESKIFGGADSSYYDEILDLICDYKIIHAGYKFVSAALSDGGLTALISEIAYMSLKVAGFLEPANRLPDDNFYDSLSDSPVDLSPLYTDSTVYTDSSVSIFDDVTNGDGPVSFYNQQKVYNIDGLDNFSMWSVGYAGPNSLSVDLISMANPFEAMSINISNADGFSAGADSVDLYLDGRYLKHYSTPDLFGPFYNLAIDDGIADCLRHATKISVAMTNAKDYVTFFGAGHVLTLVINS
ncbi:hypothetical protein, partial [Bacillus smithii]|uniref:hypothetical protein n=1 Tax=Bacillus smithii TaxID=1479 RepID=UPI003D20A51A